MFPFPIRAKLAMKMPSFMSHDGSRIAVIRGDRTVKLFDAQIGKELVTLTNVARMAFPEDGRRAISASADKKIECSDQNQANGFGV